MNKSDQRYLSLLKQCLTRMIFPDGNIARFRDGAQVRAVAVDRYDPYLRAVGRDWPSEAETMIGLARLKHLQDCVVTVIEEGIQGDLVETGVWRGGASILMRAVLACYNSRKNVWLCDSFQGLPDPDDKNYPQDNSDHFWQLAKFLAVPLTEVQNNFRRYGLLDKQVKFLVGYYRETMVNPPIGKIALLRVDCDMYESVSEVLNGLYDKVVHNGFVVIDDYSSGFDTCKHAVDDFRRSRGIMDEMKPIDWSGVYWRKKAKWARAQRAVA